MPLDRRRKQYRQFQKANQKRIELISKEFSHGLSFEEQTQLKELEKLCSELIPAVCPEQWKALEQLEAELKKSQARIKKIMKKLD